MNKWTYFIGCYVVVAVVIVGAIYLKPVAKEISEDDPNYFLKKELQNFYTDSTHSFASSFWCPEIEKRGLTYSFDAIVVLRDRYTSAKDAERKFAEVFGNYQRKLNSIPHIRPFLAQFPLPAKCLSLSLQFVDDEGKDLLPPYIENLHSDLNNKLMFAMYHPSYQWHYRRVIEKQFSQTGVLKEFLNPPVERTAPPEKEIKIPIFKNKEKDPPFWKAIGTFMSTFAEQHHFYPLALRPVGQSWSDQVSFGFAVWGKEKILFDDAHIMAATCARDFLEYIRTEQECKKFMKWRGQYGGFRDSATIADPHHFAFRISLWDEGINRQPSPYIAEIQYDQGFFKYFTSDEGQRLVLIHEETFDEAMDFLNTHSKRMFNE